MGDALSRLSYPAQMNNLTYPLHYLYKIRYDSVEAVPTSASNLIRLLSISYVVNLSCGGRIRTSFFLPLFGYPPRLASNQG